MAEKLACSIETRNFATTDTVDTQTSESRPYRNGMPVSVYHYINWILMEKADSPVLCIANATTDYLRVHPYLDDAPNTVEFIEDLKT